MAIQSKLISLGTQIFSSKGGKKAAATVGGEFAGNVVSSKPVKTLASSALKTTPKLSGSFLPAVSGGKIVKNGVTNFAEGIGGTAKLFGYTVLPVAAVGGTVYTGARIWDYVGDVNAKTQALREYDMALKLADQEGAILDERRKKELEFDMAFLNMEKAKQAAFKAGEIPSDMLANAGSMASDYFPIGSNYTSGQQSQMPESGGSGGSLLFALLGIGLVGGSAYYFSKKKK